MREGRTGVNEVEDGGSVSTAGEREDEKMEVSLEREREGERRGERVR